MLPLASATLDKLSKVPNSFWINLAIFIVGAIALVYIIRFLKEMNKIVLCIIIFVFLSVVGFSWIYERNEPAFLTPTIDVVAQFFPSKGAYKTKQAKDPDTSKDKKAPSPKR